MTVRTRQRDFRTPLAVMSVVIAVFALSLGDAVIKASGALLPLWQMYIVRSALALPLLVLFYLYRGQTRWESWFWVSIRSMLLVLMWLCYYSALPIMPLSLAAAAYYTAPIFIVILVALSARKVPSWLARLAVVIGFAGVMAILRPEGSSFTITSLLPVLAAFLYALAMMLTASKCRDDDPIALAIALNIAFVVGGSVLGFWSGTPDSFIFGAWVPIDLKLIAVVSVLSAAIVIGSVGAAVAYQNGPPTTIAVFDYSYLLFGLIWGFIFFSEIPGWTSILGIILIFIAGLFALYDSKFR